MNNTPTIRIQKVRKNRTKRMFIIFSILAAALLICSIIAPLLCPYDPYAQDLSKSLQPPSAEHWLGTDRYGRDLLSRVIIGSQTSIYSTLILVAFMTVVGTVLGILAGLYGGILDTIIMRISDIFLAFPGLVFALAVAGALGGGVQNAIIALAAVGWPKFARLARSQTLAQKKQQYSRSSQSNPTLRALSCMRYAFIREGRASGTPLKTDLLPSFSFIFICSQFSETCSAVSAFTSPKT